MRTTNLRDYLFSAPSAVPHGESLNNLILRISEAAAALSLRIADGCIREDLAAGNSSNIHGEVQKHLDVLANEAFADAARISSVAYVLSEESEDVLLLNPDAMLALAIDPLDGSSNIAVNAAIGTIFSIVPTIAGEPQATFNQGGRKQLAAGYVIYGAQVQLIITLGHGTHEFTLDRNSQEFVKTGELKISEDTSEFAINVSNYRHWLTGYRNYIDDCLEGESGPRAKNFNMRWLAALVGETHRILTRGGIFMYPVDSRKNYEYGRLRLNYECSPIAFLIEQAGGSATDGHIPILDVVSSTVHQRSGFCFGASGEIAQLSGYLKNDAESESPLFGHRGLFQGRA